MRTLTLLVSLALATPAHAFCGFFVSGADQRLFNHASHVVLLRKGQKTVMTISNDYKGPLTDFAMVVPVPVVLQKKQVRTLAPAVFHHIDELTAPRLVEYWEQDPCSNPQPEIGFALGRGRGNKAAMGAGGGGDDKDYGVKIEARFSAGEYEILILSAEESGGLERWLHDHSYKIPDGAAAALAPYVHDGQKFFVAKVDAKKVKFDANQQAQLSPLQFAFDAPELRLPVRLGLLNSEGKQDLIVWTLHPSKRFEVANYPNILIPTNLEVVGAVRKAFGAFYAELFDLARDKAGGRAVVTEYSWDTGSCDPCPTPPLEDGDLSSLGAARVGGSDTGQWVVTRMHTRYDPQSLSEDLIFHQAKPIVGGRADREDGGGPIAGKRSDSNNFQARYIIRHYWGKKVVCDNPQRNVWGGPPDGNPPRPAAARGLAEAPRGTVKLDESVRSSVPALGLAGGAHRQPAK